MQRILFLENKMQEDAASQERTQEGQLTRLNPISGEDSGHTSILYQERTVDTPQSYVRRGQWTHLNPMSGENSEHPSILVRRHTCISGEATPRSCGRERSRSLIMAHRASKTPRLQDSKTPSL